MSMGRDPKRYLIHAAVALVLFFLLRLAWDQDFLNPGPGCPYCGGKGQLEFRVPDPLSPGFTMLSVQPCATCDGSGLKDPYSKRFERILPLILRGLWGFVWIAVAGALVWGMKLVDCRLCCGAGRLALEVSPPGEAVFSVDQDCVACDGRGRLGVLDRWVLWMGWEQRPPPPKPLVRPHRRRPAP
jgi:hypothetical protein